MNVRWTAAWIVTVLMWSRWGALAAEDPASGPGLRRLLAGDFQWKVSPPVVEPASRTEDPCHAIKDPTVVHYDGRWHLFCTIRSAKRTHQIEYLNFVDWKDANAAPRHILSLTDGYFCAPQVFYFSPQKRWYLIYQVIGADRQPQLQPACSTSDDLSDPNSWSKPRLLFDRHPEQVKMWIDFWVICDDERAHLFFTALNGQMWHCSTRLADFPSGWNAPRVVLASNLFEASHTYRVRGSDKYLTVVEAQDGPRRYYQAYLADRLDGSWQPLAVSKDRPFASPANVHDQGPHWTDSISHGELLRAGFDEKLEINPDKLRFLFQGVSDQLGRQQYGKIPWRLGLLEPAEKVSK